MKTFVPTIYNSAQPLDSIDWLDLTNKRAKQAHDRKEDVKPWCRVENAGGASADVYIYGSITPFAYFDDETSAASILEEVRDLTVETINVHINSPGGSVFEGVAIYQILSDHAATVNVKIDALCGSIATTIALAGDSVEMADNALFMIHNPAMGAFGESKELRSAADMLDTVKETIINTYAAKTNQSRADLAAWMDKETYFTASEALENGFIDSIKPLKTSTPKNSADPLTPQQTTLTNNNRAKHASRLAVASFDALAASCQ